jgi:L-fuculose-phosphate aldolase
MQLRAMAAGGVKEVSPELAAEAREFLLQPSIVRGTFAYWARRAAGPDSV